MRVILVFILCFLYTGVFSKEDIVKKMATAVCDCMKENEKQKATTSYTTCVIEHLEPYKHSIKKLIKHIIKTDNKGEDLDALDAFNDAFEKEMNNNCPGLSFDYSGIFNALLK